MAQVEPLRKRPGPGWARLPSSLLVLSPSRLLIWLLSAACIAAETAHFFPLLSLCPEYCSNCPPLSHWRSFSWPPCGPVAFSDCAGWLRYESLSSRLLPSQTTAQGQARLVCSLFCGPWPMAISAWWRRSSRVGIPSSTSLSLYSSLFSPDTILTALWDPVVCGKSGFRSRIRILLTKILNIES